VTESTLDGSDSRAADKQTDIMPGSMFRTPVANHEAILHLSAWFSVCAFIVIAIGCGCVDNPTGPSTLRHLGGDHVRCRLGRTHLVLVTGTFLARSRLMHSVSST
jgi:hypothetical protein